MLIINNESNKLIGKYLPVYAKKEPLKERLSEMYYELKSKD